MRLKRRAQNHPSQSHKGQKKKPQVHQDHQRRADKKKNLRKNTKHSHRLGGLLRKIGEWFTSKELEGLRRIVIDQVITIAKDNLMKPPQ